MRTPALLAALFLLAACTSSERDNSAREWAKAECNRVLDHADRERCMKRVEAQYGGLFSPAESREPPRR